MQTDRELLELAAKAAGMSQDDFPRDIKNWRWNPLDDDGDALRLAVALDIKLTPGAADAPYAVAEWWERPGLTELRFESVVVDGDRAAALRRAGVLAAAAIGASD